MTATAAPPLVIPGDLGDRAAFWMEVRQGFKETLGPNDGPELREWRAAFGTVDPCEWCALSAWASHFYVSKDMGVRNPFPHTLSALRVWGVADESLRVITPRRGDVGILDHGHGKGHVIVCTRELTDGIGLTWASGNTNAAGSRTGDSLLVKTGDPEEVHHGDLAGWLRFSRALTLPLVA